METNIKLQAAALCYALLLGTADGFVYDVLRPIRYRTGTAGGIVFDFLFCLLAAVGAFVLAMGADNGRLGVTEIGAAAVGFIGYMHLLSPFVYKVMASLAEKSGKAIERSKKILKKIVKSAKLYFQKIYNCFIIKK